MENDAKIKDWFMGTAKRAMRGNRWLSEMIYLFARLDQV